MRRPSDKSEPKLESILSRTLETSGLARPLILERVQSFLASEWKWDRLRTIVFHKDKDLGVARAGGCVSALPRRRSPIILQTSDADFLSKIQRATINKTSSLCIALLHTPLRDAWLRFWPG